jgi:hypothetical protein
MSPKKYRKTFTPPVAPAASVASVDSTRTAPTPAPRAGSRNLSTAIEAPTAQAFKRDLAFIGMTTAIIVILMVIAYFVVPR